MNITYVHRTVKLYSMPNNYNIYILYARNIQAIPTKQINAQLWLLSQLQKWLGVFRNKEPIILRPIIAQNLKYCIISHCVLFVEGRGGEVSFNAN
jgi:hypothetical protein